MNLSSLTKLNPLSLASTIAESACDALLPKELEFIGDLAGLAIDLKTGNFAKAMDDLQDLQADLSQQLASLAKRFGGQGANPEGPSADLPEGCAPAEPSPPPPYGGRVSHRDGSSDQTAAPKSEGRARRFQPPPAGNPARTVSSRATNTSSEASARTEKAEPRADTKAATSKKAEKSADVAAPKNAADAFFAKSDKDLMNALRSGSLPEAVSKDPAQMQRLQMRINDYAQMNQLITTMLSALHEMNKQVIQNLRV